MKELRYIFMVFLLCCTSYSYGQKIIEGKVIDKNTQEALLGATIYIPNQTKGTTSDYKGNFKIKLDDQIDSIIVSYIGYQTKSIPIKGDYLNVSLQKSETSLNEIVVSANRNPQARVETPMAISTISPSDIRNTKATQLDQILNQSAGVYMVDLGNEQHSMTIRQPLGYNDYFLYLEDGIPIRPTGNFNHNALIEINGEATQKIEIIKGPASSIYGSEAIGGAVNFITKKPTALPHAKIEAEMGTFGYKRTNISTSTTFHKLGLSVGGYYANRNVADEFHEDFHKYGLNLRADYPLNYRTQLTATAAYIDYYTDQKGGLDSAQLFDKNYTKKPISPQRFTYRKIKALRTTVALNHQWNRQSNSSLTIYYRNNSGGQNPFYREGSTSNPLVATGEINVNAFKSYGSLFQHSQQFKWLSAQWISGLSIDYSPTNYHANFIWIDKNMEGVYYDFQNTDSVLTNYTANLFNPAAYSQLEFQVLKNMRAVIGVRYDQLSYSFNNKLKPSKTTGPANTNDTYAHFTPKVGFTYDLGNGNGVYTNYSVGFSPPNISSLYSGYTVPDLKPSTFYNYEVGGWINIGHKGYAEVSLYQLNGTNEVVSVRQANGTTVDKNAGKTSHQGIELSVKYTPLSGLLLKVGGTYAQHKYIKFTNGENVVNDNAMAGSPPYIVNSKISYKPQFFKGFRMSLEWQGMGKYYTDPENKYTYKGFNVINARIGYQYKGYEIWANCINLANTAYATIVTYGYGHNTYYPGKLRTFNVGIGYNFDKKIKDTKNKL